MSSKVFPGKLFPAEHQTSVLVPNQFVSIWWIAAGACGERSGRLVVIQIWISPAAAVTDHLPLLIRKCLLTIRRKEEQNRLLCFLHCIVFLLTQSGDAFQCSASDLPERVWSIHLNGSFFTSNCWSWAVNCWDRMRNEQFRSNRARAWGGFWVGLC